MNTPHLNCTYIDNVIDNDFLFQGLVRGSRGQILGSVQFDIEAYRLVAEVLNVHGEADIKLAADYEEILGVRRALASVSLPPQFRTLFARAQAVAKKALIDNFAETAFGKHSLRVSVHSGKVILSSYRRVMASYVVAGAEVRVQYEMPGFPVTPVLFGSAGEAIKDITAVFSIVLSDPSFDPVTENPKVAKAFEDFLRPLNVLISPATRPPFASSTQKE